MPDIDKLFCYMKRTNVRDIKKRWCSTFVVEDIVCFDQIA